MRDTDFLRFIAIILITNSHLDMLYPIPYIGSGGALGDALFFMLSGLGLAVSYENNQEITFKDWFLRRVGRIYPTLWVVVILFSVLMGAAWREWGFTDYIENFLYPTEYWFISAILLFYFLVFIILKLGWTKYLPLIINLLLLPYFYVYFQFLDLSRFCLEDDGYFKWLFYFQVMLFGMFLVTHYRQPVRLKSQTVILLLVFCFLVYTGLKFAIAKSYLMEFQFLIHLMTIAFLYFCLMFTRSAWVERIMKFRLVGQVIVLVGSLTLEIYLIQAFIYNSSWVTSLGFPANILLFTILVIASALVVRKLAAPIQQWMGR